MTLKRKQAICVALLLLDDEEEKKQARRSVWVKPLLEKRTELGVFNNLFQELLETDALKDYIRMDQMHFNFLADRLYPYLLKQDTTMSKKKEKVL